MAKRHRSKRGIPCGNVVSERFTVPFGDGNAELCGTACKLLIYLSPAQTARNRRRFDRFVKRTGMRWNVVDAARSCIEVTIDVSHVHQLESESWCHFAESVIDSPVPLFARGSAELGESAARFGKLNRHQQAHGIERHKFGVDRAPRKATA